MPFSGNHTHPLASTSGAGVMELATDAEVVANPETLEALAVTPYTLGHYTGLVDQVAGVETSDLLLVRDVSANKDVSYTFGALKDAVTPPQATTEVLGIIELATDGEVLAGIDAERAVTPAGLEAWADGNPATEADRGLIELATDAEVIGGTDTERAVTPAGLEAWSVANPSTETDRGLIELATDAEVIAGTDTERAVTPSGLEAWSVANPSTETDRGLIELATDAEVIAGTDTERAVTPAGLEAWSDANPATEIDRGLIELATDAEVIAGTDTERAVTPSGLEAWSVANPATETDRGLIELATDAEVITGTDTERAVTPAGLDAWSDANPATETDRGLIELATDAEVVSGIDTERAVTPSGLDAWSDANPATETDRGLIELATVTEAVANPSSNQALAVTPYTLGQYVSALPAGTPEDGDLILLHDLSQGRDVSISYSQFVNAMRSMTMPTLGTSYSAGGNSATLVTAVQNTNGIEISGGYVYAGGTEGTEAGCFVYVDNQIHAGARKNRGSNMYGASSAAIGALSIPAGKSLSVGVSDGSYAISYTVL
jgi:predicted small integral membrane protein